MTPADLTALKARALAEVEELERYGNATSRHIRPAIAELQRKLDEAQEYGKKARIRENKAEDARVSAVDEAARLRAELEAVKAERDRQYDENVALISELARLKDDLQGERTLVAAVNGVNRRLKDREAGLEGALQASIVAIDDWLHQYAGELCNAAFVTATARRISEAGGTLAYIAQVQEKNREYLTTQENPCVAKDTAREGGE
jgi:hypothetical protein